MAFQMLAAKLVAKVVETDFKVLKVLSCPASVQARIKHRKSRVTGNFESEVLLGELLSNW